MSHVIPLAPVDVPCGRCCEDFDIEPVHLLDPSRLSPEGLEFLDAHGVTSISLEQRALLLIQSLPASKPQERKILHRCQHLDESKLCRIYGRRPKICRDYQCAVRTGREACLKLPVHSEETVQ